jgi:hypothetical protein
MTRAAILLSVSSLVAIAQGPIESDGYVSLFNGRDLGGWVGDEQQWTVQRGALRGISDGKSSSVLVLSEREFGDFELRFDLCIHKGAGLVHMRGLGRGPVGVELEVGASTVHWLVNGTLVFTSANVRAGEWNAYRIVCKGTRFIAFQNEVQSALTLVVGHIRSSGKLSIVMPGGTPSEIELRSLRLKE